MKSEGALLFVKPRRHVLFKIYFAAASDVRIGKFVGDVGGRRVIHFGGSSFCLKAGVGFRPRWEDGGFLGPMNEGGFIAPVKEFAHGAAMDSGQHESLHLHVGGPEGCGPEGVMTVAQ